MSESLRTCSRCHSTMLTKYFSINKKGELYKLCDKCRTKANNARKNFDEEAKQVFNNDQRLLKERLKLFTNSVKYFETLDIQYYDEDIKKYIGCDLKTNMFNKYIDFCNSQVKWIKTAIITKD